MRFTCGCIVDALSDDDYCEQHFCMACHCSGGDHDPDPGECPACFRNRMLSVNTDYATTRLARLRATEGARQRDKALGVRLAEPGEFPEYLTQHSKVHQ
jgi:hypothetical protein